ncbi:MAG: NAD(P)-dependent oxidoreductase [Planctomycetota bacterium]
MTPSDRPLIVVTGSSGLIGSSLCHRLTKRFEVVGLDLDAPENPPSSSFHFIPIDLTKDSNVATAWQKIEREHGPKVASIVHLAAYYDFSGEPSDMYEKLTVEGTRRLLKEATRRQVEQFIFSSTLLVMKPVEREGQRLDEDSETLAEWAYPESKLRSEAVIHEERGDIPAVILRIAGIYDDSGHSLPLAQHIQRIWNRDLESFLFPGDVSHGQPYLHLDDLVTLIEHAIDRRRSMSGAEVFLAAEPEVLSHEDLQSQLGTLIHGRTWPTLEIPAPVAKVGAWIKERLPGDEFIKPWMIDLADDHYPVDIGKAKERLSWKPEHRLARSLPRIVQSMQKNPSAWFESHGIGSES